jgi:hypothetical protein
MSQFNSIKMNEIFSKPIEKKSSKKLCGFSLYLNDQPLRLKETIESEEENYIEDSSLNTLLSEKLLNRSFHSRNSEETCDISPRKTLVNEEPRGKLILTDNLMPGWEQRIQMHKIKNNYKFNLLINKGNIEINNNNDSLLAKGKPQKFKISSCLYNFNSQ